MAMLSYEQQSELDVNLQRRVITQPYDRWADGLEELVKMHGKWRSHYDHNIKHLSGAIDQVKAEGMTYRLNNYAMPLAEEHLNKLHGQRAAADKRVNDIAETHDDLLRSEYAGERARTNAERLKQISFEHGRTPWLDDDTKLHADRMKAALRPITRPKKNGGASSSAS